MLRWFRFLPCLLAPFFLTPAAFSAYVEDFDDDPTLPGTGWELYVPRAGVVHSIDEGWWKVTMPENVALDHWTSVDYATQLRRIDPQLAEDFVVETRVHFLGSGDPENPTWPPVTQNYQAGIMIYFGQYNAYYWGFYRNTILRLERSGANNLCQVAPNLRELSLQVKRIGSVYSFSYREKDSDPWILVCNQTYDRSTYPVIYAGLIFKSWSATIQRETFLFDYFKIDAVPVESPGIWTTWCDYDDPVADRAWVGLPFVRGIGMSGYPTPTLAVPSGQDMTYDAARGLVTGWTPEEEGEIALELRAENEGGAESVSWAVRVATPPIAHDDEFDEDPRSDPTGYWQFYEPLAGVEYSIEEDLDGTTWWRLGVPPLGEGNLTFDHWTTLDRAVQLRHAIDAAKQRDFVIETRIRIDPEAAPPPNDEFHVGLMLYFGQYDILYFGPMQERSIGGRTCNVSVERSGTQNVLGAYAPNLLAGAPVRIRIEKKCDRYNFFLFDEGAEGSAWIYIATYATPSVPQSVGLVMKTWGDGLAQRTIFDFDYFDILQEETPPFISTWCDYDAAAPDLALLGMPYIRGAVAGGDPFPGFRIAEGPATMEYDPLAQLLVNWTPDEEEIVRVRLEATNAIGTASEEWRIEAKAPCEVPDETFDEDPRFADTGYWEFYEPLAGVEYSIGEDPDGTTWWRLGVPPLGEGNLTFDHWTTLDRAVQLRHPLGGLAEFIIETRIRIDPEAAPPPNDEFHVGLMLYFGQYDILYFGPMQERSIGGRTCNVSVERSGTQNVLGAYAPNLLAGAPVRIRIEKKCDRYNFFLLDEGAEEAVWIYIATYRTPSVPQSVGLVMKTWGGGLAQLTNFDIDYFDIHYAGEVCPPVTHEILFIRGDTDGNGLYTIGDGIQILERIFVNRKAFDSDCEDTGDLDDDGVFTIGDAIWVFNYLFADPPVKKPPYPPADRCGTDPTPGTTLGCNQVPAACR